MHLRLRSSSVPAPSTSRNRAGSGDGPDMFRSRGAATLTAPRRSLTDQQPAASQEPAASSQQRAAASSERRRASAGRLFSWQGRQRPSACIMRHSPGDTRTKRSRDAELASPVTSQDHNNDPGDISGSSGSNKKPRSAPEWAVSGHIWRRNLMVE